MEREPIHHGRNIARFRKMFGLKQEALAARLGGDQAGWDQKKVSYLESKDVVPDDILKEVAEALHVTPEALKNFSEEIAFAFISSTFNDSTIANYISHNNPIYHSDKAIELLERLLKEKDDLIRELLAKLPPAVK
jgi:transcriptional regulator with XRE-family HTH domain